MVRPKLEKLGEIDGYPVWSCVRCGACCKASACGFGYWDEERKQCGYLIEISFCFDQVVYSCAIADEIEKNPTSAISPAFGTGCCRVLFNEDRRGMIEALRRAEQGGIS